MAQADLALTAGGSTLYELAYLGLPAVVLEVADNQAAVCRAMDQAGASFTRVERRPSTGRCSGGSSLNCCKIDPDDPR